MGQSTTPKALALGVSLSLACGLLPGAAFADEAPEDDASANAADSARGTAGGADSAPSGAAAKPDGYDKADFYPVLFCDQITGFFFLLHLLKRIFILLDLYFQPASIDGG